jgi:hypothetical protein
MYNTQTTQSAYALMILLAGFAVMANYGRGAAVAATNGQEAPMSAPPAYGPAPAPASGMVQFGLVQTGVAAVTALDGAGRQSIMPVFQVVQLQSTAQLAAGSVASPSAPLEPMVQQPAESKIPQGINVAPPAGMSMSGTLCEIKGVRVLTETPASCGAAGGQVLAL